MALNLYEHQRKAVDQMKNGCILCGGVGTGKSRTALAYFYTRVCGGRLPSSTEGIFREMVFPRKLYIVTTARKRDTGEWEEELVPFVGVDYQIDSWNNISKYVDVRDAFFIFDEQRLVGKGKWVKCFYRIAEKNQWVLLSATPGDTWMDYIPVFVANGFYKNRTDFIRRHVVYASYVKFPKVERYLETARLERLRKEITVTMIYEKRASKHHQWAKVSYDQGAYSIVTKDRKNPYEDMRPIRNVSELCYLERKVVNSDESRLEKLGHILRNHPKVILFYNFDYELEMLRNWMTENGVVYSEWNGHKHQPLPTNDKWCYIVQYTAGAEGWNCTICDTIVFFSLNYSYKTMEQAAGRIDRLNTPFYDLFYYHIFSDAPIDKAIKKCVLKKKNFNEKNYCKNFVV